MPEVPLLDSELKNSDESTSEAKDVSPEEYLNQIYTKDQQDWFRQKADESNSYKESEEALNFQKSLKTFTEINDEFVEKFSNLNEKQAWHIFSCVTEELPPEIVEWLYSKYELAALKWMTPPWLMEQAMKEYSELRGIK